MSIVCTGAVALDRPSQLDVRSLEEGAGRTVYLHAMHSVVDWFALAVWGPDGELLRALSLSGADEELVENVGQPPLELGEAALANLFGLVFEGHAGMSDSTPVDPLDVTLAGFRLTEHPGKRRLFGRR